MQLRSGATTGGTVPRTPPRSPASGAAGEIPDQIYYAATALTAITDNAALTYLGSLVDGLSDQFKYALAAGAVTGGGLTVIANAPNPAGYSILNKNFENNIISPLYLFLSALGPTIVAIFFYKFI